MDGISVIVPCFNREMFLKACLDSILAQERNFSLEIIVSDDGSTDGSRQIAEEFGSPVRFLAKPPECRVQGPGPTRNRAIQVANYPLIAFLDSDDLFLPGHLQRLYDALHHHPECAFAIDQLCSGNSEGENAYPIPYPDRNYVELHSVFLNPYVSFIVSLVRKSVFDEMEYGFDEELLMAEDVDLFLRILEKHSGIIVPGRGAIVREHAQRSIWDIRKTYIYADLAMKKAIARYPYPKSLVSKRKAVIQYRLAQADFLDRRFVQAGFRLLSTFFLDPIRVFKVLSKGNHH